MIKVLPGDCLDVIRTLADCSIDAVCTDPPYGLEFMGKEWDKFQEKPRRVAGTGGREAPFAHHAVKLDVGRGQSFQEYMTWARECLRVLKPGGHLVAFGGTRTYHRLACAIEDAGFEIRDQLQWIYGNGFNKNGYISLDLERTLTKLHSDGKRYYVSDGNPMRIEPPFRHPDADQIWHWAGSLKPAHELICLARKPLSEKTSALNCLRWGTGALNIDGCRIGADGGTKGCDAGPSNGILGDGLNGSFGKAVPGLGRWPANIILDGSLEVLAGFPESNQTNATARVRQTGNVYGEHRDTPYEPIRDSGSAARFFYHTKADANDRIGSRHPTIKPVALMRWLVRLITPPGGTVLDCFAGSGTTGEAAWLEGFSAILIEREAEYLADIARRMEHVWKSTRERRQTIAMARVETAGPLFEAAE